MSELVIFKGADGKLDGWGEKGRRAWAKWRKIVGELEVGETLQFTYKLPRSPRHHRFFFARLAELFAMQERFDSEERFLDWLKVGSGHADLMPGRDGVPCAVPRSISWASLEEQGFIEFTRAMNDFLWTPYAQEFLWPHLTPERRHDMVDAWFRGAR